MGALESLIPEVIRRSYLRKFALVVIGVLVVAGAAGFLLQGEISSLLKEQTTAELETNAQLTADSTESWVDEKRQTVRMLSEHEAIRSGREALVRPELSSEADLHPSSVEDFHYVNLSTQEILASSDQDIEGQTLPQLGVQWTGGELSLLGDTAVQRSFTYEYNGHNYLAFISPVVGGEVGGLSRGVVMVVNASEQAKRFHTSIDGGQTSIVDSRGVVAFDVNSSAIGSTYQGGADATVLEEGRSGTIGMETLDDGQRLVAHAPVEGTDWVVLAEAPASNAFQVRDAVVSNYLLLIAVFVMGFVFIGATIGRNTVNSLRELTGKAEELENDNLDTTIGSDRSDEIGQLFQSFASMRDSLQNQIQTAEQARKEAEVSRTEAMELNNYLQDKADEYAQIMQRCATGDLTARMEGDGEVESMDRIAEEFNKMIKELEKTTSQLKDFSDEVETAGDVVRTSSKSVRDASEQVADSVQKISDDAYDQKERLQEISETIDALADELEAYAAENEIDIADSLELIEEIANMLQEVVNVSEETMAESENVAGAAEEQAAELNEVSEQAQDLVRYAGPLQEVLDRFETEATREFYFPTGPGSEEPEAAGQD
jgi:methyl-accepting chemotaxis protein